MSDGPATEVPKKRGPGRPRKSEASPAKTRARPTGPGAAGEEPKPAPWKAEALELGAGYLVRLLWFLSTAVCWVVGGKLEALSDEEHKAGTKEAVPLVRRFPALAAALMLAGLPLWLVRTVAAKFKWLPKPAAKQKPPAASTEKPEDVKKEETAPDHAGATVHPIKSGA